jgi:hypothetical protein
VVWQFQAALLRLEARARIALAEAKVREELLDDIMKEYVEEARRSLAPHELPKIRSLFEGLGSGTRLYVGGLSQEEEQRRLLQSMEMSRENADHAQKMVSEQQREDQERTDRNTRILGYGLAALAAVTAFPILIGQNDWKALRKEIAAWPDSFGFLAGALQSLHPHLVVIATVSAIFFIALLIAMLAWSIMAQNLPLQGRRDRLSYIGGKIGELKMLAEVASPTVNELIRESFRAPAISRIDPDVAEPEPVKELRQNLATLDESACERMVEVWNWLGGKESRATERGPVSDMKTHAELLRDETERFIVSTELLNIRPVPYPLPRTLCLYRYRDGYVSGEEFRSVLRWYGFSDQEIESIDLAVEEWKHLPLPQLFEHRLREDLGVSALRERPVDFSNRRPDPAGENNGAALEPSP